MTGLKRLRLSLGLSLREVSAGLEPRTWQAHLAAIEDGETTPGPKMRARLCAFYGLTLHQLERLLRPE